MDKINQSGYWNSQNAWNIYIYLLKIFMLSRSVVRRVMLDTVRYPALWLATHNQTLACYWSAEPMSAVRHWQTENFSFEAKLLKSGAN